MNEFDNSTSLTDFILTVLNFFIYGYTFVVMISYLILGAISIMLARKYLRSNESTNYFGLLQSPEAPKISIIAPAFNEELTIVDNIRSMMSLQYPDYEVVLVNDGSKDNTLQRAIDEFNLEPITFAVPNMLPTQEVRNVYRSKNPVLKNLLVVDKENGGKADALNCGINCCTGTYILNIDVDCILERDCLLKLAKPILQETDSLVIATGGVVRVANNCVVEKGVLKTVNMPRNWLARFQTLEYLRAFLLGRLAWGRYEGLMLVSGALGIFNKEILVQAGGYSPKTVGEDLELTVRMRKYCLENNIKYRVDFIPEPLVWTEVPENTNVFLRQRNRWTRGSIETIMTHKNLFLNPKYKKLSLLSYTYWIFFEWLSPLIEFFGLISFLLLGMLNLINFNFFLLMLALVLGFSIAFTLSTIYVEEATYFQYKSKRGLIRLMLFGFLEPFLYHPLVVWGSVKGNWDYFFEGKVTWGKQVRKGFTDEANKPQSNKGLLRPRGVKEVKKANKPARRLKTT